MKHTEEKPERFRFLMSCSSSHWSSLNIHSSSATKAVCLFVSILSHKLQHQASHRFYPFIFKYTDFFAAQYVSFLTQKREQMLDEFDSTNMLKFSWTIGLIGTHGYQEVTRYKGRENDVSTKL